MRYDASKRFDSNFYRQNARVVAQKLLGCKLVVRRHRQWLAGWIVETEAYLDRNDPACHATRGQTRSNATMFGPAGLLYVYTIHAKHCMNVVTGPEGRGQAVLIRGIEPLTGMDQMSKHRGCVIERDLMRGPSRICQALDIDRSWDKVDLTTSRQIWIEPPTLDFKPKIKVARAARIGVTSGCDLDLRFFVDGNRFVSGRVGDHTRNPIHRLSETGD